MKITLLAALLLSLALPSRAHDIWVETNTNLFRVGDVAHVDLKLGNHGNGHRDFKLASKLDPQKATLQAIAPDGKRYDLKPSLRDVGYTPKEGYWTAPFVNDRAGLYCVAATSDAVVSYAPERAVKSAKTFFVAAGNMARVSLNNPGFDRKLGHALELVPESNPVTPMGPGTPLKVRLFFKGRPLSNAVVSFVPQGETLHEGFDARYQRRTNANGRASFEPKEATRYLVVAHHQTNEKGSGYDFTAYSATMTVYVPQICPCCGG